MVYIQVDKRRGMQHHPRARYWGYALARFPAATREHLESTRGDPCYLCARPWGEADMEVEHRVPRCRGGGDEPANVAWACQPCNRRKHKMTEDEFRKLLEMEAE